MQIHTDKLKTEVMTQNQMTERERGGICEEVGGYRAGLRANAVCGVYTSEKSLASRATNVRFAECEGRSRGGIDGGRPRSQLRDSLSADREAGQTLPEMERGEERSGEEKMGEEGRGDERGKRGKDKNVKKIW